LGTGHSHAQNGRIIKAYIVSIRVPNRPNEDLALRYMLHIFPMQPTQTGRARSPLQGVFINTQRCNWHFRAIVRRRLIVRPQSALRSALARYSGDLLILADRPGSAPGRCDQRMIASVSARETQAAMGLARQPSVNAKIEADARSLQRELTSQVPNAVVRLRPQ
jgi:hypothetical protein